MWKAREEVVIMVQLYSANYGLKTLLIPHCSLCISSDSGRSGWVLQHVIIHYITNVIMYVCNNTLMYITNTILVYILNVLYQHCRWTVSSYFTQYISFGLSVITLHDVVLNVLQNVLMYIIYKLWHYIVHHVPELYIIRTSGSTIHYLFLSVM